MCEQKTSDPRYPSMTDLKSPSHLIEPRFDEFRSASEKASVLGGLTSSQLSLAPFRQALGSTPMIAAGGFGPNNLNEGLARGDHDLVAFGRFFW